MRDRPRPRLGAGPASRASTTSIERRTRIEPGLGGDTVGPRDRARRSASDEARSTSTSRSLRRPIHAGPSSPRPASGDRRDRPPSSRWSAIPSARPSSFLQVGGARPERSPRRRHGHAESRRTRSTRSSCDHGGLETVGVREAGATPRTTTGIAQLSGVVAEMTRAHSPPATSSAGPPSTATSTGAINDIARGCPLLREMTDRSSPGGSACAGTISRVYLVPRVVTGPGGAPRPPRGPHPADPDGAEQIVRGHKPRRPDGLRRLPEAGRPRRRPVIKSTEKLESSIEHRAHSYIVYDADETTVVSNIS